MNSIIIIVLLLSCKNSNQLAKNTSPSELINIELDIETEGEQGRFDDYFSSAKIIALETTDSSLFSRISRMILFKEKIFILDKEMNTVYIFMNSGKFLTKIRDIGKGPNEYLSLTDFTIDKKNEQIILYTDRPYKLLTYNFEGKFIKDEKLKTLYSYISYDNEKLLLLNNSLKREYLLVSKSLSKTSNFLAINSKDKLFENYGLFTPSITKDKKIHLTLPYSNTIYEYRNQKIQPKYHIDFGSRSLPDDIFNTKTPSEIFRYSLKNNYGFAISNFRESKDYVTFTYQSHKLVIYSKKDKLAKTFKYFKKDMMLFYNHFAHDGDDNNLISIYHSLEFKNQINKYKKSPKNWEKVPDRIKQLNNKISVNDNPLLIIYTFKENN